MKIMEQLLSNSTPLILAPMAALSHCGVRQMMEKWQGADFYFSEMIACRGLKGNSRYLNSYLSLLPEGDKVIYQLVGSQIDDFVMACEIIKDKPSGGIDINMGCGAPDIRKKGGGIFWMGDTSRAAELICRIRPLVKGKTLSVKIRLGEEEDGEKLLSFARALVDAGIDFITLHPRIRKDKFARTARWSYVKLLVDELGIPVIGNGDVNTPLDLIRVKKEYKPHGVMIGRSAIQKPWLFYHLREKEKNPAHQTIVDLEKCWTEFFENLREYLPAELHPTRSRRFFWYATLNLPYGHNLNMKIQNTRSARGVEDLVFSYLNQFPEYKTYVEKC